MDMLRPLEPLGGLPVAISVEHGATPKAKLTISGNTNWDETAAVKPQFGALSRERDYWVIRYQGSISTLRDCKGLRYVAYLLRHRGKSVHALTLLAHATERRAAGLDFGGALGAAPPADRARVSVTKAIRRALARIAVVQPALWRHLRETIQTGMRCAYREAGPAMTWEITERD